MSSRLSSSSRLASPGAALGNAGTIVYCFVVTTLLMLVLKATIGVRVSEDVEVGGLDLPEHAETAYSSGSFSMAGRSEG